MKPHFPRDLVVFFRAGSALRYDPARCEAGAVTLRALADLRVQLFPVDVQGTELEADDPHRGELGCYRVPAVDLTAGAGGGHDATGLLVWLPVERRYGTWDPDHSGLELFAADTRWADIVREPARFINAQWKGAYADSAPTEPLAPWQHQYVADQRHEPEELDG